jgi:GNAT superfamily N-acetyltransferase
MRDAQGIIAVDRATFGDCHYTPEYILSLQADAQQCAWLAQEGRQIVGFVSAFPTHSLATDRWEIDELAVRPASQGKGTGAQLVTHALHGAATRPGLAQARALVATDNQPSMRVFVKNGFSPVKEVHLLLYEVSGRVPRPQQPDLPRVRIAQAFDALVLHRLSGRPVARVAERLRRTENLYLIAARGEDVYGYVELIHVRTLQYEGYWIESVTVVDREKRAAAALFAAAIEETKRRKGMDEVGYLAAPGRQDLYAACVGQGFTKVGEYRLFELNLR